MLIGDIYLIGVGSAVVCSTLIGSARASTRGTDNQEVPRFFYARIPTVIDMKSKPEKKLMHNTLILTLLALFVGFAEADATRRALVFGLGKQKDTRWGRIHGDRDIPYVVSMLRAQGYTDIKALKNEQATKAHMVNAFRELAARCRKGDVVYIHYSGHGQLMTDLNGDEAHKWNGRHADWDESWIPYDAYMTYCKEDRGEKHFCDDEVAEFLQRIRKKITQSGRITVAIDACHSGDATCGSEDECVRGVDAKFNIPRPSSPPSPVRPIKEQWQTISACKPYQLSTEIKGKQIGKLTYAMYLLGKNTHKLSNRLLESKIAEIYEKHSGRIRQTPMVTGKR